MQGGIGTCSSATVSECKGRGRFCPGDPRQASSSTSCSSWSGQGWMCHQHHHNQGGPTDHLRSSALSQRQHLACLAVLLIPPWLPWGKGGTPLQASPSCSHQAGATSTITLRRGVLGSSHLTGGFTSLWGTETPSYILCSLFCKRSLCCFTAAVHWASQRRWESCQLALSWLTGSGGHLGRWEDPGLTRFSHKIILVFMTICLWWALLRGTSSAKRREIKIIVKPKTIKINPGLGREMHTFHPCLDMTHQYSPLHAA